MTKADKVRLLLLSMDSHLPGPKPPRVYSNAEPGAQASYYVPCGSCWNGRTLGGKPCHICRQNSESFDMSAPNHGCSRCLACDVNAPGQRKVSRRERNFDPYSGKTMDELASLPPVETPRKTLSARVTLQEEKSDRGYGWERERLRNDERGSYNELRRQLDWLRDRHIARYELLSHWVSSQDDKWWTWSESAQDAVNTTIGLLAERMPDNLRIPNWLAAKIRTEKKVA